MVASIHHVSQVYARGPFLIITPLSTIAHWKREFLGWTDLNVIVLQGTKNDRDLIRTYEYAFWNQNGDPIAPGSHYKFNVMLTTYEVALSECGALGKIDWRWVVVDEAHRLKNKNSKLFGALQTIHSEHRVILTGTPVQNSTAELWNLLHFIDGENFASSADFDREFTSDVGNNPVQLQKLHAMLRPYLLRRLKEDVAKNVCHVFCLLFCLGRLTHSLMCGV